MRCGLLARKIGMTHRYSENGEHIPVSVLKVENPEIVGVKKEAQHGYSAVQMAAGDVSEKRLKKPIKGFYAKEGFKPKAKIVEFRISDDCLLEKGQKLRASHFVGGQYVDVRATSIGKGFAGSMKRHGFAGLSASHGVSISHRSHGSTGHSQDPGRVFKGKKMAGHMGAASVTTQNLKIIETDDVEGLILIQGAVPGAKGGWVVIKDALKKALPSEAPKPAGLTGEKSAEKAEEGTKTEEVKEGGAEAETGKEASQPGDEAQKAEAESAEAENAGEENDGEGKS